MSDQINDKTNDQISDMLFYALYRRAIILTEI